MRVMRGNKDSVIAVLEAFSRDPLTKYGLLYIYAYAGSDLLLLVGDSSLAVGALKLHQTKMLQKTRLQITVDQKVMRVPKWTVGPLAPSNIIIGCLISVYRRCKRDSQPESVAGGRAGDTKTHRCAKPCFAPCVERI